ncbi:MAG: ParB/RepB/Spo0J family partition protein [bacterium]|nr:ParB/RepB/Spo0J family partition protein [bacterium]
MTTTAKATTKKQTPKKATFSAPCAEVHLVPVDLIDTAAQIRTEFDQDSILELANDIGLRGLMQPVLLNPNGDRFTMIAGERRLRAIKANGMKSIPALLTKASTEQAFMMQLAENIQREELSLEDECTTIIKLYETLGSLKAVSEAVKKSVPWCSKRYSMKISDWHHKTRQLLEDGISEDMELLKAFNALAGFISWYELRDWENKVRKSEASRDDLRAALKEAKDKKKTETETVSQAKPYEPPPPPPWTLEDAIEELDECLSCLDDPAIEVFKKYTTEQQHAVVSHFQGRVREGMSKAGITTIRKFVFEQFWSAKIHNLEAMALIAGYAKQKFILEEQLIELQEKEES